MGYDNSVQWAVSAQLGDVYRACAQAETIDDLISDIREPLAAWLDIDVITLAFVDDPIVVLGSIGHLSDDFLGKIRRHSVRCFEGKSAHYNEQDDVVIQHVGGVPCDDLIEPDGILWTGAIERERRLIAVLTFYRQASQQLSALELTALRQIRALISESVQRIHAAVDLGVERSDDLHHASQVTSDVATTRICDADLMKKAFGPAHLAKVQGAMIQCLSAAFPRAFMLARIGADQVVIIAHPGDGLTLVEWSETIRFACRQLRVNDDTALRLEIELGEVQGVSGGSAAASTPKNTPTLTLPQGTTPGAIAG
ncbi:MAG: hypothetical protein VX589_17265 [Myxococcota bacterium]|nr:hypothetical protein [Myxococcota bacterium]